ncbi:hypothetical protein HPB50_008800 [Hyalomma asiaticum]|uniref:Uncharacterized protein n=1 Tax=Hyalomma asiaticum TaxID=266040 RepID=A0ACB7SLY3_HYAAI|nr:hypothetical protein HPB50_008800 [Hyalomma asiaticum]
MEENGPSWPRHSPSENPCQPPCQLLRPPSHWESVTMGPALIGPMHSMGLTPGGARDDVSTEGARRTRPGTPVPGAADGVRCCLFLFSWPLCPWCHAAECVKKRMRAIEKAKGPKSIANESDDAHENARVPCSDRDTLLDQSTRVLCSTGLPEHFARPKR